MPARSRRLLRGEGGSLPELIVFTIFVVVCAAVAIASFQSSGQRRVSSTQRLIAADVVRTTLSMVEGELNSSLRTALLAAMYDVGSAGGDSGQVEQLTRLYLNQRISQGWRYSNLTVEVPVADENNLRFEWRADGSVRAWGYLDVDVRHIAGPRAHGAALDVSPPQRFERLRSVAHRIAENLAAFDARLDSEYAAEGLEVELENGEGEVRVVVRDAFAAPGVYVGSSMEFLRYVVPTAGLGGGGDGAGGDGGVGGVGDNQGDGGGASDGTGGEPNRPEAWIYGRVVERYTGVPLRDVDILATMTNPGAGGWHLYFPAPGARTDSNGNWSIRVATSGYGATPTSWSADFTFSKSGWSGALRKFSSTATYQAPNIVLNPSGVGTVELEALDYGSFTLSINPWSSVLCVYWDSKDEMWKTWKPAETTATVSGTYRVIIDFSSDSAGLQISLSPGTVLIVDPREGGTGFVDVSVSASVTGLGPNYVRYPKIWARGRTGLIMGKDWTVTTREEY
ncbi:MAG: hypothetical protein QMC89_02650 [Candidatus Hodarchaeaceae archaeon]|nr:hypothetical protein [Candidatus Hodarchaeaceae archaeon]